MSIDENIPPRRVDLDNEPYWPAVQWGAAAIAVVGLLLFLPAGAWLLSLAGA